MGWLSCLVLDLNTIRAKAGFGLSGTALLLLFVLLVFWDVIIGAFFMFFLSIEEEDTLGLPVCVLCLMGSFGFGLGDFGLLVFDDSLFSWLPANWK